MRKPLHVVTVAAAVVAALGLTTGSAAAVDPRSAGSSTSTASTSVRPLPSSRLLPASQVPQLNDHFVPWRVTGTQLGQPARTAPAWQRLDLGRLGARRTAYRAYVWDSGLDGDRYADTARASDTIATFASTAAASRAQTALVADLRSAPTRLHPPAWRNVRSRELLRIRNGYVFLVTSRVDANDGFFDYVAVAHTGRTLVLVTWKHVGQDSNYSDVELPVSRMLADALHRAVR